jgi:hypothetical protein
VQHGAVLGEIDLVAAEHGRDPIGESRLPSEFQEEIQGGLGDSVLRIIKEKITEAQGKAFEAVPVGREQIPHVNIGDVPLVLGERPPGRKLDGSSHRMEFPLLFTLGCYYSACGE